MEDVTLEVGVGELVGLLGPNGAGKTTLLKIIAGVLDRDKGELLVNGATYEQDPIEIKGLIGYLPENNPLYDEMLVSEFLELTATLQHVLPKIRRRTIGRVIERTGLQSVHKRPIGELSKGFRQRTGLAQAIMTEPQILLLDEPTEGLDPNQRLEIRSLIQELAMDHTVVLSTHVLQEVRSLATRFIVLDQGTLIADGPLSVIEKAAESEIRIFVEIKGRDVVRVLRSLPGINSVKVLSEGPRQKLRITSFTDEDTREQIFEAATENGWTVLQIYTEKDSLESVFRELTGKRRQHDI